MGFGSGDDKIVRAPAETDHGHSLSAISYRSVQGEPAGYLRPHHERKNTSARRAVSSCSHGLSRLRYCCCLFFSLRQPIPVLSRTMPVNCMRITCTIYSPHGWLELLAFILSGTFSLFCIDALRESCTPPVNRLPCITGRCAFHFRPGMPGVCGDFFCFWQWQLPLSAW